MYLVTGATGHVGSLLVARLAEAGTPTRALVRREVSLPVATVPGDLREPESLDAALLGVDAVFLVWPLGTPDGAAEVVARLARSVPRVVYLSAHGASGRHETGSILGMHGELESLLAASGVEWTFLRAGGFATNTLGWADQVRAGVVRWPYAGAARSLVHEADLAAVAARALGDGALTGARPHLTGPQVLTQAEQVATIGSVLGRPVRFEELPRAQARAQMLGWGWSAEAVDGALDAWAAMVSEPEVVAPDLPELLGRPARSFEAWVRDHRADFS